MPASDSMAAQLLAYFLCLLGLIGTLVATALPHWRHTAYFTSNLITATSYMKGLWMECVSHTTGIYQCELNRSMLSLPQDLQVARALMVFSSVISTVGTVVSAIGMKCTRCLHQSPTKDLVAVTGGACFVCGGMLCLITVCWTIRNILYDAYNLFYTGGINYGVGLCVYIGFASAIFSIFGGGVLCATCCNTMNRNPAKQSALNTQQHQSYQPHSAHRKEHSAHRNEHSAHRNEQFSSQLSVTSRWSLTGELV
ncbi:claudin-14 [Astyanax mexicanus]|uniref:claudin-14 n=1 Tax=Astyanax mexicanus TaxID=7994 RepID=UPI0020CB2144|nr:claudin-14 [Astyanax mexicanus]